MSLKYEPSAVPLNATRPVRHVSCLRLDLTPLGPVHAPEAAAAVPRPVHEQQVDRWQGPVHDVCAPSFPANPCLGVHLAAPSLLHMSTF